MPRVPRMSCSRTAREINSSPLLRYYVLPRVDWPIKSIWLLITTATCKVQPHCPAWLAIKALLRSASLDCWLLVVGSNIKITKDPSTQGYCRVLSEYRMLSPRCSVFDKARALANVHGSSSGWCRSLAGTCEHTTKSGGMV
jgi:hypothetical protein